VNITRHYNFFTYTLSVHTISDSVFAITPDERETRKVTRSHPAMNVGLKAEPAHLKKRSSEAFAVMTT
jgi:hypothetical protein